MSKIFQLMLGSPEDSIIIFFIDMDGKKTNDEFMEALSLHIIDFIDLRGHDFHSLSAIFSEIEYDEDESIKFDAHMSELGFIRVKPDITIHGSCWDRVAKKGNKYILDEFNGFSASDEEDDADLSQYLMRKGFEKGSSRRRRDYEDDNS